MSGVNEIALEKKFLGVSNTQDSIQTLSLWILHHRAHHKKIVDIWMKVLKKAKISHRLTLFYLANDVVQNGKRKGYPQFVDAFSGVLRDATLLVRNEKIRPSVERVFNIWGQRSVYGSAFISELHAILVSSKVPKSAPSKLLAEFKHESVINKIREVVTLEIETAAKLSSLNINKLDASTPAVLQQLKDRSHGQRLSCDFDEATTNLEEVIDCLDKEAKQRSKLILLLEQSEIYYDTQRGEAKIVANAYKNFGSKIKSLQKKLEERKAEFPSPVPSPCADAPSPINSDPEEEEEDTVLPNVKNQADDCDSEDHGSPQTSVVKSATTPPISEKGEQKNNIGNPIPTLSNFFPTAAGVMSSWLDAFTSSSKNSTSKISSPSLDSKKSDPSSSLDTRLSNLMQSIPSLSAGLQSSLFGGSSSSSLTPLQDGNSPPYRKSEKPSSDANEDLPENDDRSGQNTPLQDEDVHSSNHSGFFNLSPTRTEKKPGSKDVLKGLTNLIQTASNTKADNSDYNPRKSISEFISKIVSPHSSSPATFQNSPPPENNQKSPHRARVDSPNASNSSYSPSQVDPYAGHISPLNTLHENLSFIPTLVPSTPHDMGFDFHSGFIDDEYNPETENYLPDDDVDDDNMDPPDSVSPRDLEEACESPDDLSDTETPKTLGNRRQSTLITLVAEEKMETPTEDHASQSAEIDMSQDQDHRYLPPHCNVEQGPNMMTPNEMPQDQSSDVWPPGAEDCEPIQIQQNLGVPEPVPPPDNFHHERPFPSAMPPPVADPGPLNGGSESSFMPQRGLDTNLVSYPMSKIETVNTYRNDMDNRWFENDWGGQFGSEEDNRFRHNDHRPNFNRRSFEQRDFQFRRGEHHSGFRPRNNWPQRERRFTEYDQGPPHPKRFAPFHGRGRGWRNNNFNQPQ